MFIEISELKTHLYPEQITAISKDDETLLTAAIDGAVAEARGYLHKYDRDSVFGASGGERNALLLIFVKDIAVWHYINLANPGVDHKVRQDRYNRAITWLKSVQAGEVVPDLPEADTDDEDGTSGQVSWSANTKRENYI